MDIDAGPVRPVHRQADIPGYGITGGIDADSADRLALAVGRRFEPGVLQLVGHRVEIALALFQPGIFYIGSGLTAGAVLPVAVDVVHAPILRQRDIAALAGFAGSVGRSLLHLAYGRCGCVLRLQ